ncbi:SLC13 family permease [Azospirillum halopraeferens]|uniref:SLC13 family permease n=1 Tax=Azospirillum halopraeferens TaxID=34010 RepID=UPI00040BA419|nr:SLC13 family permease [Azospirillum halopraeferens]
MTFDQIFVLVLLAAVLVAFIREWVPPDIVALSTTAALLAAGVLSTRETLEVFSNPGVVTVGAMFVLSAALERTGCIEALGDAATRWVGRTRALALLGIVGLAVVVSAFINNTPVVVILTPVVIRLCQHLRIAPSKMLIPLSYAAIFGGTCSLIGTSTNLLVDGVAQRLGQPAFGLFEIAPLGIVLAILGTAYLLLFSDRLLPNRETVTSLLDELPPRQFLTEMIVLPDAAVIGKSLEEARLTKLEAGRVIDVVRGDESLRRQLPSVRLQAGDRLVIKTGVEGVIGLRERAGIGFEPDDRFQEVATRRTVLVEGIVGPRSGFVNHRLSEFNLRRRYGVYIIAVHRQGENLRGKFEDVRLEVGDTVLLEGPAEGIRRLVDSGDLINLTQPEHHPLRTDKAWIAVLAVLAVVVLSFFEVMPIAGLALIASVAVVLAGCVPHSELYKSIEWRILFLIFGMLPLGMALEKTGVVELFAVAVVAQIGHLGPWMVLALLYLLATILTEVASNNAVGVLLTPIAIGIAQQLGVDPRPFLVAVMFAASACFSTPIGYQTHLFVYGAGGYKYLDFVRIGLPLNVLFWIIASLLIPVIWPF